jgi:cytochrome bd-type quinol oxidase subunit 2
MDDMQQQAQDAEAARSPPNAAPHQAARGGFRWLMLIVLGVVLVSTLAFVVPKYAAGFQNLDIALPSLTVLVLTMSRMTQQYAFVILPIVGIAIAVLALSTNVIRSRAYYAAFAVLVLTLAMVVLGIAYPLWELQAAMSGGESVESTG